MTAKTITEIKRLQAAYKRKHRLLVKKHEAYELCYYAFYQEVTNNSEQFHKQLDAILKG